MGLSLLRSFVSTEIEFLNDDFDRADYLQSIVLTKATGGELEKQHYSQMRNHFMVNPTYSKLIHKFKI